MIRLRVDPRPDWQGKLEALGFTFHSLGGQYWDESVCYEFTADQIDELEAATELMHRFALEVVEHVLAHDLLEKIGIPAVWKPYLQESWNRRDASLYGRFDFAYDGRHPPRLLEYNADTPTSLYEAAVVQWFWLQDCFPSFDQFNSLHEKLLAQLERVTPSVGGSTLYFASVEGSEEDFVTVEYLRDLAVQAGLATSHLFMGQIGWNRETKEFVDLQTWPIKHLFKLYPWENMIQEAFGQHLLRRSVRLLEPPWKMILSNKAILPLMWELHPGHPNLLSSSFDPGGKTGRWVRKPFFCREGASIVPVDSPRASDALPGHIWQRFVELPCCDGRYPVVGSWIVGDQAAGMGIREDETFITRNTSHFIPHRFR